MLRQLVGELWDGVPNSPPKSTRTTTTLERCLFTQSRWRLGVGCSTLHTPNQHPNPANTPAIKVLLSGVLPINTCKPAAHSTRPSNNTLLYAVAERACPCMSQRSQALCRRGLRMRGLLPKAHTNWHCELAGHIRASSCVVERRHHSRPERQRRA